MNSRTKLSINKRPLSYTGRARAPFPSQLPELVYPFQVSQRSVSAAGHFSWRRHQIYLSVLLEGQFVALRPIKLSPQNDNALFVPSRNVLLTGAGWELETDRLLMTQKERDRLVALKKARKRLIAQKQAAVETSVSERPVRRLLRRLKRRGDRG